MIYIKINTSNLHNAKVPRHQYEVILTHQAWITHMV